MQDQPKVVFDLIFGHLAYEDVLVLRATCKALKEFVDEKKSVKLNLFVRKYPYHHRLFYTGEPIGQPHSYRSDDLTILQSNRFRKKFSNLQQMTICSRRFWSDFRDRDATEFDLSRLNYFKALCCLQIDEFPGLKGKLNLKELEIAAFQTEIGQANLDSSFELNCPKLRALKIVRCKPSLTRVTNRLDYLHYGNDGDQMDHLKSIRPNLRRLTTICFESIRFSLVFLADLRTSMASIMASLCQIRLEPTSQFDFSLLDKLANSLTNLMRDPRRNGIQFTFSGGPIRSPDELRQIAGLVRAHDPALDLLFLKVSSFLFLNEHPDLHFLFSAARAVQLHKSIELSEEMIEKLKSIEFLEFRNRFKPSQSTFELFARTCKSLRSWCLYNQTLTERLLEMLSNHLVNLERLAIFECQSETLRPLAQFRNLEAVELDFDLSKDDVIFIYTNSRTVEAFDIYGKELIKLLRTTTTPRVHKITTDDDTFEFNSLSAMLNYYRDFF